VVLLKILSVIPQHRFDAVFLVVSRDEQQETGYGLSHALEITGLTQRRKGAETQSGKAATKTSLNHGWTQSSRAATKIVARASRPSVSGRIQPRKETGETPVPLRNLRSP
jgi:hypothetical protein